MELEDIDISASTGLPSNEWTTFAGFNRVGLYSNNCIFTEPSSVQFYIDTASALLFVRYTEGKPLILLSDKDLKDGYVKVTIDGIDYQILVEADFLVNMHEDSLSKEAIELAYNNIFKTEAGRMLCREMFSINE